MRRLVLLVTLTTGCPGGASSNLRCNSAEDCGGCWHCENGACREGCPAGDVCAGEACVPVCKRDDDCDPDHACSSLGVCEPGAGECDEDSDCVSPPPCKTRAAVCRGGACHYAPLACEQQAPVNPCLETAGTCDPLAGDGTCLVTDCCVHVPAWPDGSADPQPSCPLADEDPDGNGQRDSGETWTGVCDHYGACTGCLDHPDCPGDCARCMNGTCISDPSRCLGSCNRCVPTGTGFLCASDPQMCDANATCLQDPGERSCACDDGYTGNGLVCIDINECDTDNGGCDPLVSCTNTAGGRTCGDCPSGYSGTGETACLAICGDGNTVAPEACDDGFNDACGDCNATCDGVGAGSRCGDGSVCPQLEACDDGAANGTISTSTVCSPFCDGTQRCGNGIREGSEVCDGRDFGGPSNCAGVGYDLGVLGCKSDCTGFDTSSCLGSQVGCNGLPIIDIHTHIIPSDESWNTTYVGQLVQVAVTRPVGKLVIGLHARHLAHRVPPNTGPAYSTTHDDWVLALNTQNPPYGFPQIIVPLIGGFDPALPGASDYVNDRLANQPAWKGIGELDLRNEPKQTTTPANSVEMLEIYAIAATYDVPVLIHYNFDYGTTLAQGIAEFEDALDRNPDTKFIYAHACPLNLMAIHSNLYCEIEPQQGQDIPIVYGERVMLGTDIQSFDPGPPNPPLLPVAPGEYDKEYGAAIDDLCARVKKLPYYLQQRVTHVTAEELFHITD